MLTRRLHVKLTRINYRPMKFFCWKFVQIRWAYNFESIWRTSTTIIREQNEGDVCYFLEKGRVEISGYYVVNKIVCKYTKDRAKIEHQSPSSPSSTNRGGGRSLRSRRMKSILSLLPNVSKLRSREARDIIVQMLDPRAPLRLRGRALEAHSFFTKGSGSGSPKYSNRADVWWKKM